MKRKIDIIIPVHNEEKNVGILYDRIKRVESESGLQFGIIFIDDGSTDSTIEKLQSITRNNSGARAIQLRRNYGKSTALDVGFRASQAPMIITMDGDLQDDPAEIPRLIETIDQGYDVVSGWKKKRHDPWHKTMPSKLFNLVTSLVSGVKLHDFNCGFKAYRQDVVKSIKIYGEMHRFIPAIAHWKGFRVTEIPVVHHPREFGHSKYGVERLLKGLFDFLTIAFITKYFKRPMHLFGLLGLTLFIIGLIINGYLSAIWVLRMFCGFEAMFEPIGSRPLLTLGVLCLMMGALFISTGFLAEMIIHISESSTTSTEKHVIKSEFGGRPVKTSGR
ncbi:MAG TPA: glycosyltransferase family 2 protein [Spirochaetota bacterium]|nr:glycosyltransferase family 2 protein [Spirochaetota bacterium]